MSNSIAVTSDLSPLANELACYLQTEVVEIALSNLQTIKDKYDAHYSATQYDYQLTQGKLHVLGLTLCLPSIVSAADIERVRMAVVKAALVWQKTVLSQNNNNDVTSHEALIFDIQLFDIQFFDKPENDYKTENDNELKGNKGNNNAEQNRQYSANIKRLNHHFDIGYFIEDLVVDMSDGMQPLQVFSWHDWYEISVELQTPCELWRFLTYRLAQLHHAASHHLTDFKSEAAMVTQFLQEPSVFAPAIDVDNALIKYNIQEEPNPALVSMMLAYQNKSTTAQMYHHHMAQAAALWSQLSMQMIETVNHKIDHKVSHNSDKQESEIDFSYWQQQLLDESLFSRHELIRTLYRHLKQGQKLQDEGYVVHQHSYENLGRHYVLIFYGQDAQAQNSKKTIQPNLAKIAQDVATRLPIAELHHIIVLGIDFITEASDTFIDIDLWIQPVNTMTQRERQLTKQLQRLKQQQPSLNQNKPLDSQAVATDKKAKNNNQSAELPKIHLNLSIPAHKNKP